MALHEVLFNDMESLIPEYSAFSVVCKLAGSALSDIAPSNAYPCSNGWVLISSSGDSIFKQLMVAIKRTDLAGAPNLAYNAYRVKRVDEVDIGQCCQQRSVQ